jgi:hypothetical protein
MKTKIWALLMGVLGSLSLCLLTGCPSGGGNSGGGGYYGGGASSDYYDDTYYDDDDYYCYDDAYYQAWYDVYGDHCGSGDPSPGCNFYWDGTKIQAQEDPFYYLNSYYNRVWQYYDSFGYSRTYAGFAWMSPDGIIYDSSGHALNTSEERETRDLIGDVAQKEKSTITRVGKDFAEKYALSELTGINVARTLNDWATLSLKQKRARTAADVADFSKRLYGINVDSALNALSAAQKGDLSGLEGLNTQVATFWGTSPETSKAILKGWYQRELEAMGID